MSFTVARSAAGTVLLAVLTAGCGIAVPAHSAAPKPKASAPPAGHHRAPPVHATVTPPAPRVSAKPTRVANPIPQGNGGDQDADNNGGPSDGDGNI